MSVVLLSAQQWAQDVQFAFEGFLNELSGLSAQAKTSYGAGSPASMTRFSNTAQNAVQRLVASLGSSLDLRVQTAESELVQTGDIANKIDLAYAIAQFRITVTKNLEAYAQAEVQKLNNWLRVEVMLGKDLVSLGQSPDSLQRLQKTSVRAGTTARHALYTFLLGRQMVLAMRQGANEVRLLNPDQSHRLNDVTLPIDGEEGVLAQWESIFHHNSQTVFEVPA